MPNPEHEVYTFVKGRQIEVSSDEDGFKGAWFEATIVECPPKSTSKKRKKALVMYRTLLTEDRRSPLTEYIDPAYIRPLPPAEDSAWENFVENDIVDARYRDGWWLGIVRKVFEDSSCLVYFDNPSDVIHFQKEDLRMHLDWVNGKWVRPDTKQPRGSILRSGTAVEVILEDERLRDVWFPALVIKENVDATYLVKYQSSRNGKGFEAKVTVDSLHIRPTPPHYVDRNYELLESVDAVYGFGWRAGVITKVLSGKRYTVFFKHGSEDRECSHSDLRPHLEWTDGKWVSKSKEVPMASNDKKQMGHLNDGMSNTCNPIQLEDPCGIEGNPVEKTPCSSTIRNKLMGKWMELSTPCHENYALPAQKKKMKLAASDENGHNPCSPNQLNEGYAAEAPLYVPTTQSMRTPKRTYTKQVFRGLATLRTESPGARSSRKFMITDQPSAKSQSPYVMTTVKAKRRKAGRLGCQTVNIAGRGSLSKSLINSPAPAMGKEGRAGIEAAEKISGEFKAEADVPVIIGLKATNGVLDRMPSEIPTKDLPKLTDQDLHNPVGEKSMEIKEQKPGGSSQRRKRGRPRKLIIVKPDAPECGKEYKAPGSVAAEIVVKDRITNEVELPRVTRVEPTVTCGQKVDTIVENNAREVERAFTQVSSNIADDDQPLSTWIGGIHSSNVEDSRLFSGRTINGWNEAREKQVNLALEGSLLNGKDSGVSDEHQTLPFVKQSPIWETIESMEIFQLVPQRPHFRPLSKSKEEYREGSAIGIMVTFAGLFEKIYMLQLEDSKSIFYSILESLLDLEKHGFDVIVPRNRVNELLSIKDGQGQLLDESKGAEKEIGLHTNEMTKFDEEMEDIRKKINELENQYAVVKSKKEAEILAVGRIRLQVDDLNKQIENAKSEFRKAATAPWKLG